MTHDAKFQYQQFQQYFCQVAHGLEELAAEELISLGADDVQVQFRGVRFTGSHAVLYRVNYCSRLVSRVLAPLMTFGCHSDKVLYRKAGEIDWSTFIGNDNTFAVYANVSDSKVDHSKYAALRLKDAIVDQFRDRTGKRPSIDPKNPDVWISLNIRRNQAVISLDTSGGPLHKRGYRVGSYDAPLQETLAAAMIRFTGWEGECPLVDPMCGSGTILAEALMVAARVPAGFRRKNWGFQHLPDFEAETWRVEKQAADGRVREVPDGLISGSDINPRAVSAAISNLGRIPGGDGVRIRRVDFRETRGFPDSMLITNPPYGVRLGEQQEAATLIRDLGDFLKQRCGGTTAWILCGSTELTKHVGLRSSRRITLHNGPLETRLIRIDIYPPR